MRHLFAQITSASRSYCISSRSLLFLITPNWSFSIFTIVSMSVVSFPSAPFDRVFSNRVFSSFLTVYVVVEHFGFAFALGDNIFLIFKKRCSDCQFNFLADIPVVCFNIFPFGTCSYLTENTEFLIHSLLYFTVEPLWLELSQKVKLDNRHAYFNGFLVFFNQIGDCFIWIAIWT
jgi:hypothetical protein